MRQRYIQLDGRLVRVDSDYRQALPADVAHAVVADIAPYQSMATGEMIESRYKHKEHLKRHNLIEIGNERIEAKPRTVHSETRKHVIAEMVESYGEDRIRKDAKALGEHLRWNSRGK